MSQSITARQVRAARALLGWSQSVLAGRAALSRNAVAQLELGRVATRAGTLTAIERALTRAGIRFRRSAGLGIEGVALHRRRAR